MTGLYGARMAGTQTGLEVRVHGGTTMHPFGLQDWIYAHELWQRSISDDDEDKSRSPFSCPEYRRLKVASASPPG